MQTIPTDIMSTQMIKLQSNDNVEITVGECFTRFPLIMNWFLSKRPPLLTYQIERAVAERSILIKNLLEDIGSDDMTEAVPIPNVSFHNTQLRDAVARNLHMSSRSTKPCSTRSSSGAPTTKETPPPPPRMMRTLARRPPISMSGTKSLCKLTRKCFLRSFS